MSAGLMLASCMAEQNSTLDLNKSNKIAGSCIATASDFNILRDNFSQTAAKVAEKITDSKASFDQKDRAPLNRTFAEPPQVRFSVQQNPVRIDYGWTIKLAEGCVYEEAKPGFFLKSVDLDIRLNAKKKIIDDKMHYKIEQK